MSEVTPKGRLKSGLVEPNLLFVKYFFLMVISTIFKYGIPLACLFYAKNHHSNVFRSQKLTGFSNSETKFLLDNTLDVPNLASLIYRRYHTLNAQNLRIDTKSWCDAYTDSEHKTAATLNDFVKELNITRFHDLCNYDCSSSTLNQPGLNCFEVQN